MAEPLRINLNVALCRTTFRGRPDLWDAELDGGGTKHAKGESGSAREIRHLVAKAICMACDERRVCRAIGRADPFAEGIYGGELITNRTDTERAERWTSTTQSPGSTSRHAV